MTPPKHNRGEVMQILAEIQSLLSEPELSTSREAIVSKWDLLRSDYNSCAELVQACEKRYGGSALQRNRQRSEKCSERLSKYVDMLTSKTCTYGIHHEFIKALGREIWDLNEEDSDYKLQQSFQFWQFNLAIADLDGMGNHCKKIKEKVDIWKMRAHRASRKYEFDKNTLEKGLQHFKEVHDEMSKVEKKLEDKWLRETWGIMKEGISVLEQSEQWRYWPVESEESDAGSWVMEEVICSVPGL